MRYNANEYPLYYWDNPDYNIPDESILNPPTKKEISDGKAKNTKQQRSGIQDH